MRLAELRIQNLRCVESAQLNFPPDLNLIYGANGSGKTSILEAVFLLGRGRSFRTRHTEQPHRPARRRLTVFGRTDDTRHSKSDSRSPRTTATRARLDGENVRAWPRCPRHSSWRSSTRRSTGWWRGRRNGAAAGWTGECSTWNQPSGALDSVQPGAPATQRGASQRDLDPRPWEAELIRNGEAMAESRQRVPAPGAATRAAIRAVRELERHDGASLPGWAAGTVARRGAALPPGNGSGARHHDVRPPSGRCRRFGGKADARETPLPWPAKAGGRGHGARPDAAACGPARHCAPRCFWMIRRPSWTTTDLHRLVELK